MNVVAMREVMAKTQAGEMVFPDVVKALLGLGVESYFCDFALMRETLYLADGESHTQAMVLPAEKVAEEFDGAKLIAAIRGAQADTVRYPEFVKRSTAAGVAGYWAFLTGRKVVYFGRKGEMHTEEFPGAKV